jgi:hypothetical protein
MANHVNDRTLRRVSAITFKIRPEIGFSVSIPKKYDEKVGNYNSLVYYTRNSNTNTSEIILNLIFRELKIKSYNDLNNINGMPEVIDQFRKVLYKALKKDRRGFSKWLSKELIETMEKMKKKQESLNDKLEVNNEN